jgi:hypothetical protein
MKHRPITVTIIHVLLILNSLIWFVFGGIVAFHLHPALPAQPVIIGIMTLLSFAAGAILLCLFYFLSRKNKIAYTLTLVFFAMSSMVIFLDDIGWVDILVLIINLLPLLLLILNRNWYQNNNGKKAFE